MKDRRYLSFLILTLLLALGGPAAADDSAAPAPTPAPAKASEDVTVDMADTVIPDFNHYKCYPILAHSQFQPRRVHLRDQFWSTWVWVWRPRYLCNPVWKTTEDGNVFPPPNPEAHLVCYEIQEEIPTPDWAVRTHDQFGWLDLKGNRAELLCLPANKHVIVPPGG
jgi:hypothetical protein